MSEGIKNVIIVGGIPDPIGGVTTFIRRVIRREASVSVLFDLYPAAKKIIPKEFSGKYIYSKIKALTLIRLFFFCIKKRNDLIHFNFSTPRALILLFFLPKRGVKWALTLHHGDLGVEVKPWVRWVLAFRVDYALALNDRQYAWYSKFVSVDKIIRSSSYVLPSSPQPEFKFVEMVNEFCGKYKNIFVCSGYPAKIYNHFLAIELMRERKSDLLVCCLYGNGPLRQEIKDCAGLLGNVLVLESLAEDNFNYLLSKSDMYVRLNTEDSFGVAVADAVNFGVRVVATKVCRRYPGAVLISESPTLDEVDEVVSSILSLDVMPSLNSSASEELQFSYGFSE